MHAALTIGRTISLPILDVIFLVKSNQRNQASAHLLGIGLDHQDGHKRITKADMFSIIGGSAETHERMTETLIKTMEDIDRSGKHLAEVQPGELFDLLKKNTAD